MTYSSKVVPLKSVLEKLTDIFAPLKLLLEKIAPEKLAPIKFTFEKFTFE